MTLEYPPDALRVVVVDDASTDRPPRCSGRQGRRSTRAAVFHLRRDKGGEGKAAALNHGLIGHLLGDDWMEALLIADADPHLRAVGRCA